MLKARPWMSLLLMLGGALFLLGLCLVSVCGLGAIVAYTRWSDSSGMVIVAMGIGLMVLGLLTALGVLVYGIWLDRTRYKGPQQTLAPVQVVATYVLDKMTQTTVPYWQDYPPEQLRFYVRLRLPNRQHEEFECAPEVFQSVGEGMRGEAVVQGNWLCQFRPTQLQGELYDTNLG